jgi:hypothetical protein
MNVTGRLEHDEAVRKYAIHLLSEGYEVQARVEGWFHAPDYIYGYRPDIVARRGDEWVIVEIKKGEIDWPKISALERRVEREREHFKLVVVSPQEVSSGNWMA